MARKATDLLDVFRHGGTDDDDNGNVASKPRKRTAKRSASKSRGGGDRRTFDGLILTRRQVVLGGSVCCLLVALSFVLGLSAGRPGDTPAASRTTAAQDAVLIRGTMPAVNMASQQPIDAAELRAALVREYRVPSNSLRIRREGGTLILEIGVFGSQEAAKSWLTQRGLDMAHFYGSDPFTPPQYVRAGR